MCVLVSRWENILFLPLKQEVISIIHILENVHCKILNEEIMTCALLFFGMEHFKNSVFCLVISTKALSNLSYFQHHFLTRQRELESVGGTLK